MPYAEARVNNFPCHALIDTGACTNFCSKTLARKCGLVPIAGRDPIKVTAANGTPVPVFGVARMRLELVHELVDVDVHIAPDHCLPHELVVGWETFEEFSKVRKNLNIDAERREIGIGNSRANIALFVIQEATPKLVQKVFPQKTPSKAEAFHKLLKDMEYMPVFKAVLAEDTILEPMSDNLVPCTSNFTIPTCWDLMVEREPRLSLDRQLMWDRQYDEGYDDSGYWGSPDDQVLVGKTLVSFDENQQVPAKILNFGKAPIFLPAGTIIGRLTFLKDNNTKNGTLSSLAYRNYYAACQGDDAAFASPELDILDWLPPEPDEGYESDEEFLMAKLKLDDCILDEKGGLGPP